MELESATVPEPYSFTMKLSDDKNDVDYIPLGRTQQNQPLRVELGMDGNSAYHAVSLNILADWFNTGAATPGGRVTVYLEDNMQAHTTQRDHLEVVYGPGSTTGTTLMYLKINPEYISNYICKEDRCQSASHKIHVTIRGGQNWVSPADKLGQDPDETNGVLPSDKYKNAKIIRLGNIGQVDSYSVDIPDERDDVVYIPIGRYAQQDAFAFNAKFSGRGLAHVMHVTIVSDYMQVRTSTPLTTHKGKVTAIIMDTSDGTDKNKYIDVIFRQDPTTSYIFLYLKLQPEFIKSQPDAQRSVVIQPNQPPFSLTVATEEGGVDPDFDAALYLPAVKVELAKPAGGDSKYSVDLTTTKRDTDYVPLGAFKTAEATSFKLGINGWGTSHSMIVDVTTDWFNEAARGNAADRTTAFVKDHKSHLNAAFEHCTGDVCQTVHGQHDTYQHWDIKYGHSDARDMIWFYLALKPEYYGCDYYAKRDDDESIRVQCEAAAHSVFVHASSGASYIAGDQEGGFDPDVSANMQKDKTYFTAAKIDVGAIPELETRLGAAEANLTSADASVASMQSTNDDQDQMIADQGKTIADQGKTIADQGKTIADQEKTITTLQQDMDQMKADQSDVVADLQSKVDMLTKWMMSAPVPDAKDDRACSGEECVPNIDSVDGSSLAMTATGGAVTFQSRGCKTTDLCDLALDVEALKAKFTDN